MTQTIEKYKLRRVSVWQGFYLKHVFLSVCTLKPRKSKAHATKDKYSPARQQDELLELQINIFVELCPALTRG